MTAAADREMLMDADPKLRVLLSDAASEWGELGVLRVARAMFPQVWSHLVIQEAVRHLSPAPDDPRFDDPAHAEHIAIRAEEEKS